MRLVASDDAVDLVRERGGRLYVWVKRSRCCSGLQTLSTSSEAPAGIEFRRVDDDGRFELFVPVGLARLPDELQVELERFPRRAAAYWDGCAWIV